ncbi:SRPBCC domain-containing protein [Labrys sp. KNU-23]|uniref:SRPBCC family protein n=1 Tax=Labrys sp. KNU-23 TaxID=2789216 RepID=UPI0011EDE1AA|nr:SRPBCC domain-containing protein [Labrys sp. KNU-23]QEN87484.1 SRPBCC domain-containing protein [Labrys sp. KNU-23]
MTILGDATIEGAEDKTEPDDLHFESVLEAPPAKVWRALTIPDYVAAWLAPAQNGTGTVRSPQREANEPELVDCRLLAAEAPQMLRYAWSEKMQDRVLDSVVTFDLAPHGEGSTLLRITQGNFVLRPVAANLNQPTMLPKDFSEKHAGFSIKKIRQGKELEQSCDPIRSQLALAA